MPCIPRSEYSIKFREIPRYLFGRPHDKIWRMFFRKKTLTLFRRDGLYLAPSKKGRGAFSSAPIKAGEVIEVAPLMVFDETETPMLQKTKLKDYVSGAVALPASLHAR